jgi:hypothetical protein
MQNSQIEFKYHERRLTAEKKNDISRTFYNTKIVFFRQINKNTLKIN